MNKLETESPVSEIDDLKARLTRGGLSPEAVEKASAAYLAGDIHHLDLVLTGKRGAQSLVCPIPEELLKRVFPEVWKQPSQKPQDLQLEYEVNRHRGNIQSLTIKLPEAYWDVKEDLRPALVSDDEPPDGFETLTPEEVEADLGPDSDPLLDEDDEDGDPWPADD